MKRILYVLLLLLTAKLGFSQIVISGIMPNPSGTDSAFEYVQLVATQNIDFTATPYTVVFVNNQSATAKGWVNGGNITLGLYLNNGTVTKGDVFYVGGTGQRINGSGSTSLGGLTWIKARNFVNSPGDGFGAGNTTAGVIGNAGTSADGVGVFTGTLTGNDSTKKPIDCIFFGNAIGTARTGSGGYTVADNDFYNSAQGLFGDGTNTYTVPEATSAAAFNGFFIRFSGTYDPAGPSWTTPRTLDTVKLTTSSSVNAINSLITVAASAPAVMVNQSGFTNDFGLTYPGTPSSGSNVQISGTNLTDSITITTNAPFEIRTGANLYSSSPVKIEHVAGTVSATTLDIRFNPSSVGVFEDTVYVSSPGAVTQKIYVKGTASLNPELSFTNATLTVAESGGSVNVQVNIINPNNNPTTVDVAVITSSTATAGSDFTFTSPQTITFPANSSDSIVINIPINNDTLSEGNETIRLRLTNADNGALFSANDTLVITITDNDYRKVNIGPITTVNVNGVVDSLNRLYEVKGAVYGKNVKTSAGGYQFTIRDHTGGVTVFSPTATFGYSVAQGDSITVRGSMTQFNGLAELSFLDTVIFHQSNVSIRGARVTTVLGENEENDLVRFNNVTAKPGAWISGNQYVYINGGLDSIQVRIVPNSHQLIGKQKPTKAFSLIGIGGQFDNSSPYTTGYQLFPRDSNDVVVEPDSLSAFSLLTPADNSTIVIQGASTQTINMTWDAANPAPGVTQPTYEMLVDLPTGDFSAPLLTKQSNVGGTVAAYSLFYSDVITLMTTQGLQVGQSISLKWTVRATTGTYKKMAAQPFNITLTRGVMNSVRENASQLLKVYPNPATSAVNVEMPFAIDNISVTSVDGKVLFTNENVNANTSVINLDGFSAGVYFVNVATAQGVYTQRIMVK